MTAPFRWRWWRLAMAYDRLGGTIVTTDGCLWRPLGFGLYWQMFCDKANAPLRWTRWDD